MQPASHAKQAADTENAAAGKRKKDSPKRKLSYNEQRELRRLPGQIEALEQQHSRLEEKMTAPDFHQSDYQDVQQVAKELASIQAELEKAYARWDVLEAGD